MKTTSNSEAIEEKQLDLEERIRRRAHEIYLSRGDEHGSDLTDWLQAEREILGKTTQPAKVREAAAGDPLALDEP